MIISLSGALGSGKSTIAKMLSEKLGWPRYYVGEMRRQAATKRGMTLEEYNRLGETDPATDTEVDEWQKQLGKTQDNFIIEGRTSWYFIPHSVKIYVDVDPRVGAKRIFDQTQKKERTKESKNFSNVDEVMAANLERMASDRRRYEKYYSINAFDKSHFDLIVDTTNETKEASFERVWSFIEPRLTKS
ncbi:MAG: AAA family ATPase [Patescibacteria group bacterium]|nr:AAA family ATPase [Patescibacteria group bacterium]